MTHSKGMISDMLAVWADHFPPARPHYEQWINLHLQAADTDTIDNYNTHLCALIATSAQFLSPTYELADAALAGETLTKDDAQTNRMYVAVCNAAEEWTYSNVADHLAAYFATREDILHDGTWFEFSAAIRLHYERL